MAVTIAGAAQKPSVKLHLTLTVSGGVPERISGPAATLGVHPNTPRR